MCSVAGAGSTGAAALRCPQAPCGQEGLLGDPPPPTRGDTHTPSAAGGRMQQIKLEKVRCSHPAPIRCRVCRHILVDEDGDV